MLSLLESELGQIAFLIDRGELIALTFGHSSESEARFELSNILIRNKSKEDIMCSTEREDDLLAERIENLLLRFAQGNPTDFDDVPISLAGYTEFQRSVVGACRAIPLGETVTYGELAESVGHPGAARAVGSVMSSNRIPLIVPCHRVLASGGRLGGYSAPEGLAMKERLLDAEQAALQELAQ